MGRPTRHQRGEFRGRRVEGRPNRRLPAVGGENLAERAAPRKDLVIFLVPDPLAEDRPLPRLASTQEPIAWHREGW